MKKESKIFNAFRYLCLSLVVVIGLVAIIGTGGGGDSEDGGGGNTNVTPTADAGGSQAVATGVTVYLDGSGSSDANGDTLTYSWDLADIPTGSSAVLSFSNIINPIFTADVDGTYTIQLVVNDGTVDSAVDTTVVTATTANIAPVADAGVDQAVVTGDTVYLDGSGSSDANGDTLTYSWDLADIPTGSSAVLSFSNIINPIFTADVDGTYTIQLVVNDGTVDSVVDTMVVTATTANIAPVADAGVDQAVVTGDTVYLDGSGSSDANGDTLSYAWSITLPAGSSAILFYSPTIGTADFTADVDGTYTLQLVVNDGTVDSAADTVVVTSAANVAPVADAGVDQAVVTGDIVTLDGSGSSDANGDTLTYAWSITPPTMLFFSATSGWAEFTPDVDGTYTLQLVVNDGRVDSAADTVVVTSAANVAPVADAGVDQTVTTGTTVYLDGSGSSDANGDTLSYVWSITFPPGGSTIFFYSGDWCSFTPIVDGTHTVQLVVNDGRVDSAADTVVVTSQ